MVDEERQRFMQAVLGALAGRMHDCMHPATEPSQQEYYLGYIQESSACIT